MSKPKASFIRRLHIINNRVHRDLEIDLRPTDGREFTHLILTGKNGSGKTSTLDLLWDQRGSPGQESGAHSDKRTDFDTPCVLPTWSGGNAPGEYRVARLAAHRRISFQEVKTPTKELLFANATELEQVLVNLRTRAALAAEAGDDAEAEKHRTRIEELEATIQGLLNKPELRFEFDTEEIRYRLRLDGRLVELKHLPDGFLSAIQLWAEIRTNIERQGGDDWGIVLIDEVELHLHLELQERLLPFLMQVFPRVQFIATTHSPAVITSIPGAVIYDLETQRSVLSDNIRGKRYGTLMTSHFGISSDFDLDSTTELVELKHLHEIENPSPEEEARLRELAGKLSSRSHALALEVWTELEHRDS